jgi:hypothetical protein
LLAVRPAAEVEAIIEPLLDEQDARDTPPEQQDDDAKDNCKIMARLELVRSDPSVDDLLQAEFDKVAPAVASAPTSSPMSSPASPV